MKPERQQIAIAEASEWSSYQEHSRGETFLVWRNPRHPFAQSVPDFLNDLNAMKEVLDESLHPSRMREFGNNLYGILSRRYGIDRWTSFSDLDIYVAFATAYAHELAEAFLKTTGKWEEPE